MGTFLVGAVVLVCAALAVLSLRADKKKGKGVCGGDCGKCKGCHRF